MEIKPVRLRLSRAKGFNLQALSRATNGLEAVFVARRSRWRNPCRVGQFKGYSAADAVRDFTLYVHRDPQVRSFDAPFGLPPSHDAIREHLRGKNLACWCKPGDPCHADVLLKIANSAPDTKSGG